MTLDAQREAAVHIARTLQSRGHVAWFAGGCVRDELLGRPPKDYDVATDAEPDQIKAVFGRAMEVGAAFGVLLVRHEACVIEVATFREDGGYADGRRPDSVRFSTARVDAQRRDFTINGLFLDPCTGDVHDFVGGREDIDAGILRAIGDPNHRFEEDHLRLLRAARFTAAMDLTVDPDTEHAIVTRASNLSGVSRERVGEELRMMLMGPNPVAAVELLHRWGLDAPMFGHGAQVEAFPRLDATVNADHPLAARFAALSLDRDVEGDSVSAWREGVLLSNQERDGMRCCRDLVERLATWPALGVAQRKRLASEDWFAAALCLAGAVDGENARAIADAVEDLARSGLAPARLVTGDDLIAAGLMPGPHLGRVLEQVYDAQLSGDVTTHAAALDLARQLASKA